MDNSRESQSSVSVPLNPLLLRDEDVAALLQVEVGCIRYLHRVGALPAIKVGKHCRWRLEDVENYITGLDHGR